MKLKNQNLVIIVVCICMSCFIQGCSQSQNNNKTSNDNPLLADKVLAEYAVNPTQILNKQGVGEYKLELLVDELFKKVYANEFIVYDYDGIKMSVADVNDRLGNTNDIKEFLPLNLKEVTHLVYHEEWDFNKNGLKFTKIVTNYTPVREWYHSENWYTEKNKKPYPFFKKVFWADNKSEGNFDKLIAKDIIYQLQLLTPSNIPGLDMEKFCEYLTENVLSGKIKAYDPSFIVNLQKRELPKQEIENISKIRSVCEGADILIFHEDWMYDSKTMSIKKIVKGIALAGHFKIDGKFEKKTLFYIPLKY